MKIQLISKRLASLLMLSIPLNFIAINGIGNLYFSTILIFLEFVFLFIITQAKVINKPGPFIAFSFIIFFCITTFVNIILDDGALFKMQTVFLVIYLQNILTFIVFYYLADKISISYFLKLFLFVIFLASLRILIEEPDHIFEFSTLSGKRIEALFIGGVNNFALLVGIALIVSFFYIKKTILRITLCLFWLLTITLTMSRGALLGVVLTLFIVSLYDTDRKTFKALVKFTFLLFLIGAFALFYFDKVNEVVEQFNSRFLGLFTGETNVERFSSGRLWVWWDMFKHIGDSSFFEFMFGHGVGSINFVLTNGLDYESSHNIFIDVMYRNGFIVFILYTIFTLYLLYLFIKHRHRNKLVIFGVFVFLQIELFVNPFLFAAQTGWICAIFSVLFIKQKALTRQEMLVNDN